MKQSHLEYKCETRIRNFSDMWYNWMYNSCATLLLIYIAENCHVSWNSISPRKLIRNYKVQGSSLRKEEANVGKRKGRRKIECARQLPKPWLMERERKGETRGRVEGGRELLVSQTVRKRLTPRIKWYRNETIVEQMPGHKTTASSFPFPIAALSTPVEQAN